MMNIIRADLYRITRGKALFITFGIVIALAVAFVLALHFSDSEVPVMDASIIATIGDAYAGQLYHSFNGAGTAAGLFSLSSLLIMFIIPIFNVVAAHVFQEGAAKNEVTWGFSRSKIYLTRLLIVSILCVLLLFAFVGTGTILATILAGFGDMAALPGLLASFAAQSFMFIAAGATGIFLVFTIKGSFVVVEIFGGLMFGLSFLTMILSFSGLDTSVILYADVMTSIGVLANASQLETSRLLIALGVGAAFLLIPTAIGLAMFRKAEIK
jgi:ABC-2 type transport system permease protein